MHRTQLSRVFRAGTVPFDASTTQRPTRSCSVARPFRRLAHAPRLACLCLITQVTLALIVRTANLRIQYNACFSEISPDNCCKVLSNNTLSSILPPKPCPRVHKTFVGILLYCLKGKSKKLESQRECTKDTKGKWQFIRHVP